MKRIIEFWRGLSISKKFSFSFGEFLSLIILILLTNFISFRVIIYYSELAYRTGTEFQSLVWDMDRTLLEARILENEFLYHYPKIGFKEAYSKYALKVPPHINHVIELLNSLKNFRANWEIDRAIKKSNINLNLYLSSAERYAEIFNELVNNVTKLAHEENGYISKFENSSEKILKIIEELNNPNALMLYKDMQVMEKEYMNKLQRPYMYSAFNIAFEINNSLTSDPYIDNDKKNQIISLFNEYENYGKEILDINTKLRSNLRDFELQAETVNPISEKLISMVKLEEEISRDRIVVATRVANITLIIIGLLGIILSIFTARILNRDITKNIVKLTKVAKEIETGNLSVVFKSDSTDEIGQLSSSISSMRDAIFNKINELNSEITERKKIENELRLLNDELEERVTVRTREYRLARDAAESANRAKSTFLANMSHELRTPLNGILGYAHILKNDNQDNPETITALDIIQSSGNHLLTMINDLLNLSKIESGKMEIYSTNFNLKETLNQIVDILKVRADLKQIDLNFKQLSSIPKIVNGDEKKLKQILINLIGNAIKFTKKGEINLKVSLIEIKEVESEVRIGNFKFIVEDTGIGIKPEYIEKIFHKFDQGDGGKKHSEGTGLGLSISRQLTKLMGGELSVKSLFGKGSTFILDLELVVIEESNESKTNGELVFKDRDNNSEPITIPDNNYIKMLLEAAEYYDYEKIETILKDLNSLNSRYSRFIDRIKKLSDKYEMEKIINYLSSILHNDSE